MSHFRVISVQVAQVNANGNSKPKAKSKVKRLPQQAKAKRSFNNYKCDHLQLVINNKNRRQTPTSQTNNNNNGQEPNGLRKNFLAWISHTHSPWASSGYSGCLRHRGFSHFPHKKVLPLLFDQLHITVALAVAVLVSGSIPVSPSNKDPPPTNGITSPIIVCCSGLDSSSRLLSNETHVFITRSIDWLFEMDLWHQKFLNRKCLFYVLN